MSFGEPGVFLNIDEVVLQGAVLGTIIERKTRYIMSRRLERAFDTSRVLYVRPKSLTSTTLMFAVLYKSGQISRMLG